MTKLKFTALLMLTMCIAAQAFAQSPPAEVAARQEVVEIERQAVEQERQQIENERVEFEREVVDVEVEMRVAETRLAEAARRIGELSARQLQFVSGDWDSGPHFSDRPVLGVSIGSTSEKGAVEGVEIIGVSPGGAAADVGLRAGRSLK